MYILYMCKYTYRSHAEILHAFSFFSLFQCPQFVILIPHKNLHYSFLNYINKFNSNVYAYTHTHMHTFTHILTFTHTLTFTHMHTQT